VLLSQPQQLLLQTMTLQQTPRVLEWLLQQETEQLGGCLVAPAWRGQCAAQRYPQGMQHTQQPGVQRSRLRCLHELNTPALQQRMHAFPSCARQRRRKHSKAQLHSALAVLLRKLASEKLRPGTRLRQHEANSTFQKLVRGKCSESALEIHLCEMRQQSRADVPDGLLMIAQVPGCLGVLQ
jgi:hypothetical protein